MHNHANNFNAGLNKIPSKYIIIIRLNMYIKKDIYSFYVYIYYDASIINK